ncbi:TPA: hypothetical protein ACY4SM_001265 [Clostridium perfringens]|uniref:hypothetical protein n=1 Tax=Clostridium perfringens TaxID=1502 RepID=UPI001094C3D2|nr:hypothetical protein [Clostridium perfringens]TGY46414.1 hypothetical protein E5346_05210 [Clostridium perfringens]
MKIGRVREDAKDAFKSLIGFEFILLDLKIKDKFMVINPLTTEGFEKFYYEIFKRFGKEVINERYKDFLKYMMSEECGFDICSDIENFMNLRDFTDDDKKSYNFALQNFKGKYGLQ